MRFRFYARLRVRGRVPRALRLFPMILDANIFCDFPPYCRLVALRTFSPACLTYNHAFAPYRCHYFIFAHSDPITAFYH